jgi:hypothetical protein
LAFGQSFAASREKAAGTERCYAKSQTCSFVERFGIAHSTIQIEPENFQEPDSASCD